MTALPTWHSGVTARSSCVSGPSRSRGIGALRLPGDREGESDDWLCDRGGACESFVGCGIAAEWLELLEILLREDVLWWLNRVWTKDVRLGFWGLVFSLYG